MSRELRIMEIKQRIKDNGNIKGTKNSYLQLGAPAGVVLWPVLQVSGKTEEVIMKLS